MAIEDLAGAAREAVLELRLLNQRVADAGPECDTATRHLGHATEALEADRQSLHAAAAKLDKTVAEAASALGDDVSAAEGALAELANLTQDTGAEAHRLYDAEADEQGQLAAHVRQMEPRIAALAQTAEAASRAAVERAAAVAQELEELLSEAEKLLTDLAPALSQMTHDLENAATAMEQVLDLRVPEMLLDSETAFGGRMSEVEDRTNDTFATAEDHAAEVAEYVVEKFGQLVDEAMDEIELQSRELEGGLDNLTDAGEGHEAAIERAGQAVVAGMTTNAGASDQVEKALQQVLARWATVSFGAGL